MGPGGASDSTELRNPTLLPRFPLRLLSRRESGDEVTFCSPRAQELFEQGDAFTIIIIITL